MKEPVIKERKTRKKKQITYIDAHNRAYRAFTKATGIMLWAGLFNVFGIILPIIQYSMNPEITSTFLTGSFLGVNLGISPYQYGFSFSVQAIICRLLELLNHQVGGDNVLPTYGFYIVSILISVAFAGIVSYLSVLARSGKKIALFTNSIFYAVDTMLIIALYMLGEDMQNIWISVGLHVIILVFVFLSIFEYYHLFSIEKDFNKEHTKDLNQNKENDANSLENTISNVFNNEKENKVELEKEEKEVDQDGIK